ncbi:unnamed protein product [Calicophoron daubneyi]|uniref:RRM domain-containing protein n=1 Tax=Calicophoron daubneyi TaxID=300641 RepID=A0AAV2TQH4_CALDB
MQDLKPQICAIQDNSLDTQFGSPTLTSSAEQTATDSSQSPISSIVCSMSNPTSSPTQSLDHWSATLLAAQALVRTKKVFIGGVATGTTAEELEHFFSEFGKVETCELMMDKTTNRHRGFGFVTFESENAAEKVCSIHYHELNGKMVEAKKALPKEVLSSSNALVKQRNLMQQTVGSFYPNQFVIPSAGMTSAFENGSDSAATAAATIAAAALVSRQQQQQQQQQQYQNLSHPLINPGSAFVSLAYASLLPYGPQSIPIPMTGYLNPHSSTNPVHLNQSAFRSPGNVGGPDSEESKAAGHRNTIHQLGNSTNALYTSAASQNPHQTVVCQPDGRSSQDPKQLCNPTANLRYAQSQLPNAQFGNDILLSYKYATPLLLPSFPSPQTTLNQASSLPHPGFSAPLNISQSLNYGLDLLPNGNLLNSASALATANNYLPTSLSAGVNMSTPAVSGVTGGAPTLFPNIACNLLKTIHTAQSQQAQQQPAQGTMPVNQFGDQIPLQNWTHPTPYPFLAVGPKIYPEPGLALTGSMPKIGAAPDNTGTLTSDVNGAPIWLLPAKIPRKISDSEIRHTAAANGRDPPMIMGLQTLHKRTELTWSIACRNCAIKPERSIEAVRDGAAVKAKYSKYRSFVNVLILDFGVWGNIAVPSVKRGAKGLIGAQKIVSARLTEQDQIRTAGGACNRYTSDRAMARPFETHTPWSRNGRGLRPAFKRTEELTEGITEGCCGTGIKIDFSGQIHVLIISSHFQPGANSAQNGDKRQNARKTNEEVTEHCIFSGFVDSSKVETVFQ